MKAKKTMGQLLEEEPLLLEAILKKVEVTDKIKSYINADLIHKIYSIDTKQLIFTNPILCRILLDDKSRYKNHEHYKRLFQNEPLLKEAIFKDPNIYKTCINSKRLSALIDADPYMATRLLNLHYPMNKSGLADLRLTHLKVIAEKDLKSAEHLLDILQEKLTNLNGNQTAELLIHIAEYHKKSGLAEASLDALEEMIEKRQLNKSDYTNQLEQIKSIAKNQRKEDAYNIITNKSVDNCLNNVDNITNESEINLKEQTKTEIPKAIKNLIFSFLIDSKEDEEFANFMKNGLVSLSLKSLKIIAKKNPESAEYILDNLKQLKTLNDNQVAELLMHIVQHHKDLWMVEFSLDTLDEMIKKEKPELSLNYIKIIAEKRLVSAEYILDNLETLKHLSNRQISELLVFIGESHKKSGLAEASLDALKKMVSSRSLNEKYYAKKIKQIEYIAQKQREQDAYNIVTNKPFNDQLQEQNIYGDIKKAIFLYLVDESTDKQVVDFIEKWKNQYREVIFNEKRIFLIPANVLVNMMESYEKKIIHKREKIRKTHQTIVLIMC